MIAATIIGTLLVGAIIGISISEIEQDARLGAQPTARQRREWKRDRLVLPTKNRRRS